MKVLGPGCAIVVASAIESGLGRRRTREPVRMSSRGIGRQGDVQITSSRLSLNV